MNLDNWKRLYIMVGREFTNAQWNSIQWGDNVSDECRYMLRNGYVESIVKYGSWRFTDNFI